jgi:hypothetical protein
MPHRREFLAGAAIFALALGLPAHAASSIALDPAEAPTPHLARLLRVVSQSVIPRSDTPGAGDVGVGAFVSLALAHGLEGTRAPWPHPAPDWPLRADGSLRYDLWLEQELTRRAGGDMLRLPPPRQAALLAELDAQAFSSGPSPWVAIKALILNGYYSSEAGASQELQYNLIPGRWDADIALEPGARAFSSDWTAVEFG